MKLFYAPPSPFARKVRIAARERGLMNRIEEISVNPYQDDSRLLATNPAGLVPALINADGTPLTNSPLICRYLDQITDAPRLIPDDEKTHWRVLNHEAISDAIMDFGVAAMTERRHTDAAVSQSFVARKTEKIERCLNSLPVHTDDHIEVTLGDIASACALSYLDFRLPELNWRTVRPDLAGWHASIETRPAFTDTQPADHPG